MKTAGQSNPESAALSLYTRLMRATNAVTERMHGHLADDKLSLSQFGVLEALYHLGPLCQKDIGHKILKTSGNITLVVDNLEKRKFVRRETDPRDRRKMRVKLTDIGRDLIQCIFPGHAKGALAVFSVLNAEERHTLGKLLKKLGTAGE